VGSNRARRVREHLFDSLDHAVLSAWRTTGHRQEVWEFIDDYNTVVVVVDWKGAMFEVRG